MTKKNPPKWWHVTDRPPDPYLLMRIRWTVAVFWAVLLLLGAPVALKHGAAILSSMPAGYGRRIALADLAAKSFVWLVALPGGLLGLFGYGVIPRPGWQPGDRESPSTTLWKASRKPGVDGPSVEAMRLVTPAGPRRRGRKSPRGNQDRAD